MHLSERFWIHRILFKPGRVSISPGNVAVGNIRQNKSIVQCKQITMSNSINMFVPGEVLINLNSKEFGMSDLFNLKTVNKYLELENIIFPFFMAKYNKVCFVNVQ